MRKVLPRLLIALGGIALLVLIGVVGVWYSSFGAVARLSYDLLFPLSGKAVPSEACIIYIDEKSTANLQQGDVWDRALHVRLLERLKKDGARAVFFDIVFSSPSANPAVDEAFQQAMKDHGAVFIGGALDVSPESGQYQEIIVAPLPALRRAAAGWGLLVFRPVDPDYGVRRLYTGTEQKASAAWVAAVKLGAPLIDTPEEREKQRWLNYYGPAGWIPNVSFYKALNGDDAPPGFFKDKIVFVGGRSTIGPLKRGKDEFATPWVRWLGVTGEDQHFSPGVEIHATALLNLLHGEWLTRLELRQELMIAIFCGVSFGALISLLRPILAVIIGLLLAVALTCGSVWLMHEKHIWFSWFVPVGLQIPVGLTWLLGANWFLERRRRSALRRAFGHYLSPHMADRIADSEFDLRPGGKVVEATVMFTDLENFTNLSESLADPEKLSEVLTAYFTQTTAHVMENDGTIVKYIGDAVLAVWGAPLLDAKHPIKAALAAQKLKSASVVQVDGRLLRTRIGIHTGRVLAGNLGSAQRFDYTVIGDAVNFASRLEGLNKYLNTHILISDALRQRLPDSFTTRRVGKFTVVGKKENMMIHELLTDEERASSQWISDFEEGVDSFIRGDLRKAQGLFEHVISLRGHDGPSEFYLEKIQATEGRISSEDPDWTGVIAMAYK